MSIVDIYPTHAAVGGWSTQDRTIPAFAEAMAAGAATSVTRTGIEADLMGQPAGWLVLALLALLVAAWAWR
jgi:6-phosphofructokinase